MASSARLYTPEILGLATGLAAHPFDPAMPFTGRARSPSCGSTLEMSLRLEDGRIAGIGLRPQACAIGQACAAIFAQGVTGRTPGEVADAEAAIAAWLAGDAGLPDWPGIAAIAPARAFPARHGAILLPWRAALDALGGAASPGDGLPPS